MADKYVGIEHPSAADNPYPTNGTEAAPWRTFRYAIGKLVAGDTLFVMEGAYTPSGKVLNASNTGTEANPIMVRNYPGDDIPTITNTGPIKFWGANWWTFYSMVWESFTSTPFSIGQHTDLGHATTVKAEHISWLNCRFLDGTANGIPIFNADYITIHAVAFERCRSWVAGVDRTAVTARYIIDHLVVENSTFKDVGSDGVHLGSHAYVGENSHIGMVDILNNDFSVTRPYYNGSDGFNNVGENGVDIKAAIGPVTVSGNSFTGFRGTTPTQDCSGANGNALVLQEASDNVIVELNYFNDNTNHLATMENCTNVTIRNNLFGWSKSDTFRGYTVTGESVRLRDIDGVDVYHNTFIDAQDNVLHFDNALNVNYKNNVVVGGKFDLDGVNDIDADHNCWHDLGETLPGALSGTHDVTDDPLLRGFIPTNGSPVKGAGMYAGVLEDYAGFNRGTHPDIGAYEISRRRRGKRRVAVLVGT